MIATKEQKPLILLLTHSYPFGKGEEFIENEMSVASRKHDIAIISRNTSDPATKPLFDVKAVYRIGESHGPVLLKSFFRCASKIELWKELFFILKGRHKILSRIKSCLRFLLTADAVCCFLISIIKQYSDRKIVIYSYWLWGEALASIFAKRVMPSVVSVISRAHGYDLYEERRPNIYLPFRKILAGELDKIYFVSEAGRAYFLSKNYSCERSKYSISRLGTFNNYESKKAEREKSAKIRIVSCSNLVKVKRVDLICRALSLIDDLSITWTHIGSGPLMKEIEELSKDLLSHKSNIQYRFLGYLKNADVLKYYATHEIDIFLNVSSSEGIPVTMMEASSFSIPIIATNVGGVSEIVDSVNGRLLDKDITPESLSRIISELATLPEQEKMLMSKNAKEKWARFYNAEKNYTDFYQSIPS